jgi:hypothetical protein
MATFNPALPDFGGSAQAMVLRLPPYSAVPLQGFDFGRDMLGCGL